jgi:osmoprotectant transport system ATP-binding protein
MSIFDNVAVVPRLKGLKGKELNSRVERSLEMVGLPRKAYGTKKPGELSGGQKQRIGVARALAGDPELILMDEPFGALDPITREVLQDELLKLKRELKRTIIFVTHDIHEAMKMGDRVAIMKQGRLVQVAEPLTLLSRPADNFVRDFVGADNVLSQFNYMRVRNIGYSRENIPVVDENATFGEAREAIQKSGIPIIRRPYVYVTNLEGKLLGVVEVKETGSDDDEIYHFIRPISPVNEEGTVFDALQIMVERGAATVPIVDEKGFLKGLLTFGQLNTFISSEKGRS